MTGADVAVVRDESSLEDAFAVRREVFVEEQGVPPEREVDDHEDEATHLLAETGDTAVGTARLRPLDETTAKVERVAVREPFRGEGWGRRLMDRVEALARERSFERIVLHSQTAVEGFYETLGYETTSDVFDDAGIPHVEMEKSLDPADAERS